MEFGVRGRKPLTVAQRSGAKKRVFLFFWFVFFSFCYATKRKENEHEGD
jgi:hypothetical protein